MPDSLYQSVAAPIEVGCRGALPAALRKDPALFIGMYLGYGRCPRYPARALWQGAELWVTHALLPGCGME